MSLNLECQEWINTNKSARLIKTLKKSKQITNNDLASSVYLLQIAPSKCSQSKLACLMSNQFVNIFDQNSLKSILKFKGFDKSPTTTITEIGFYSKNDDLIFGCSDNGNLRCWDLRQNLSGENLDECINFKTDEEREFLTADINREDSYFIVGTNKNIDNALVYIFDIRMNGKYLHKLTESHSSDVTQVKFYPNTGSKFCSGSLDGLVCLYDLEQEPENTLKIPLDRNNDEEDETDSDEDPDLMDQVLNADSSIQKIGFLSSKCLEIDQIYAITYTNDLIVWDLQSHDVVYQVKNSNKKEVLGQNDSEDQEDEYFFDCFYMRPDLMAICKGNKSGGFKLLNGNDVLCDSLCDVNEACSKRMHRDVIRSSYWNGQNLYTAGEDGFLFKWKLIDKNTKSIDFDDKTKSNKRDLNEDMESDDEDNHFRAQSKRPNKNNNRKRSLNSRKK